ncbi:phosphotransferase [Shimazuella sp. AN120528]|nr:phosphotransferase [Shimazuella soli]
MNISEIKEYRNYWLVIGETGKWVAKPIRDGQHHVWWSDVEQELRNKGFHFFSQSKQVGRWLLSEYIEGECPTYKNREIGIPLMQTLAQFHTHGQKLNTPPTAQAAYLLSDRLFDRLHDFYHHLILREDRPEKLVHLISEYGPIFYQQANETYRTLCALGLPYLALSSRDGHMLSHRDLANHNWIVDRNQQVWLIDFETAEYDLQIGDVWQICSRIMTEHQWDIHLFQELICSYESVKPLKDWETQILACLFRFPNEFLRETIGILEKKAGYNEDQTIPYIEKIASDYPIWLQRVGQINTWFRKRKTQ